MNQSLVTDWRMFRPHRQSSTVQTFTISLKLCSLPLPPPLSLLQSLLAGIMLVWAPFSSALTAKTISSVLGK